MSQLSAVMIAKAIGEVLDSLQYIQGQRPDWAQQQRRRLEPLHKALLSADKPIPVVVHEVRPTVDPDIPPEVPEVVAPDVEGEGNDDSKASDVGAVDAPESTPEPSAADRLKAAATKK